MGSAAMGGYFGSKATSGLCQPIIALMPPHDTYIESHLGGRAIMQRKPPALRNIGIDLDQRALAKFQCAYAVELVHGCAHRFLADYDYRGRELVYCDPLYLKQTRSSGRRDHAFILTAAQTVFRLSEMTGLKREDLVLGAGAHLRVIGKGRRERRTPLAKVTRAVLKAWLREPQRGDSNVLFPNARGGRLSVHGVQYLLNKHRRTATRTCPSLKQKRVTVHRLRHTMAVDMLQEGVDRATIALWLGHQHVQTTQIYLDATLAMKEKALRKVTPHQGRPSRYRPDDRLLAFLKDL